MMAFDRTFSAPREGRAVRDLLQTVLVAELMHPSKMLWFLSAWISDIGVIDNTTRSFSGIRPDWPAERITLSFAIDGIIARGGKVGFVLRDDPHNQTFIERLQPIMARQTKRLGLVTSSNAHAKALVGDTYVLDGSMNFTHFGLNQNGENLRFQVNETAARQKQLAIEQDWGGKIAWH